jgi:hypothetical protein
MGASNGVDGAGVVDPDLAGPLSTGPFDVAFRAAVRLRGLTLQRLRWHLAGRGIPIGVSSLSDWQHGRSRPGPASRPAVRALEQVLRLPTGSLVRLLVTADGGGAPRPRRGLDERDHVVAELLAGLPGGDRRNLDVLVRHDKVYVDAFGHASTVWSRVVVRAQRPGVDRFVVRYFGDPGCDVDSVRFRPLENCRLGEVRRHRSGVAVAELLFDSVLAAGQTWVFEERLVDPTGEPCTEHAHGFLGVEEQYLLEVRFDPARLPSDCHAFGQPGLRDERRRTADLPLNADHAVHVHASGGSAGLIGISWSWP